MPYSHKDITYIKGEEHTLTPFTFPFHEGEYVVNQFLDLMDFIITIIGKNIQCELVGVEACFLLPLWGLKDERRRLESVSYYGNDKNDP